MFLFPLTYIVSFLYALKLLLKKNLEGVLFFIVFGLPVYTVTLTLMYKFGFPNSIKILQSFKEIVVIIGLVIVIAELKKRPKLLLVDYLMLFFLFYPIIFLLLPIGSTDFGSKFIAYKTLAFFPLVYFLGRLCTVKSININYLFSYVSIVTILASLLLISEVITDTHFQTKTGFAEFMNAFYHAEPTGNYGLSWTFESSLEKKRFASFFTDPIELSSSVVITLSILLALATTKKNKFQPSFFQMVALIASLLCIVFAVSRASFAGYFLLLYCYGWICHNKKITTAFHLGFLLIAVYFFFLIQDNDLMDLVINTVSFQESSSLSHLVQWIEGGTAIIQHPFGLGLGASGRATFGTDKNVGGENQLIIIGVQTGVISILIYLAIYYQIIKTGLTHLRTADTKTRRVILAVVLIKVGLIIPLMTSYIDSFTYLTYFSSFLSGYMINLLVQEKPEWQSTSLQNLQAEPN